MGWLKLIWRCAPLVLLATACAHGSPRPAPDSTVEFYRGAVESLPQHIQEHHTRAYPIRESVESEPFKGLRNLGESRIPLRDAVEYRPPTPQHSIRGSLLNDPSLETEDVSTDPTEDGNTRVYYGAANYLNNKKKPTNERLQQGNMNLQAMQQTSGGKRVAVCYVESWAAYRAPPLAFTPALAPKGCTHLHYAFATLDPETYAIAPIDYDYDVVKGGYRAITGVKRRQPGLNVLISVGGAGSDRLYAEMIDKPETRQVFIESAIGYMRDYDFDGLDLHWTYSGDAVKREKLTTLLNELREKFSALGYLLAMPLPASRRSIAEGYDLGAISRSVDYAVLEAWDMYSARQDDPPRLAVHHSALFQDPSASGRDHYDTAEGVVKYLLKRGMTAGKLVLGVPLFGRSYTLYGTGAVPGAPVTAWGDEGLYTQSRGLLAYFEICMGELEGRGKSSSDSAGNTYAVFDKQFISYDGVKSVIEKMKWVSKNGLAGGAAWAIDMDDFRGLCGPTWPLLTAMIQTLNDEPVRLDQSQLKRSRCEVPGGYLASETDTCAAYRFCSGGIEYRLKCENGLYDPMTGLCGHSNAAKCVPGESLRISVMDAAKNLAIAPDTEWNQNFDGNDGIPQQLMALKEDELIIEGVIVYNLAESGNLNFDQVTEHNIDFATTELDTGIIHHEKSEIKNFKSDNLYKLLPNWFKYVIDNVYSSKAVNEIYDLTTDVTDKTTHVKLNESFILERLAEFNEDAFNMETTDISNDGYVEYETDDPTLEWDEDETEINYFPISSSSTQSSTSVSDNPDIVSNEPLNSEENTVPEVTFEEAASPKNRRVVCYMTSWGFYRRGEGKFVPEHIDTRLCTHIVYAYATLTPDTLEAKEFDPWTDLDNNLYERVTSLQDVKVLLGLGGWTDSAGDKYSRLVASDTARRNFVTKITAFLKSHNFDGLHIDWNYPVCWQSDCRKGAASDKTNYALLIKELSEALHKASMELGVAVSGYKEIIEQGYDLKSLSASADFLSAMTYDYHGGWESTTGHATPLTPRAEETLPFYSIEYAVKELIAKGADPSKLNLGLAFYGQSYRLEDVEGPTAPGSPAAGPGEPGEFTKQPGMLAYYEICYKVKNQRWNVGQQTGAGPYAHLGSQWVGYDDPKSIKEKVEWALKQGLGGITAWAVDMDDFSNRCCAEPFPLLRAAVRALGKTAPAPPSSPCERPPVPVTPSPPTTTTADGSGASGGHGSHGGHDHSTTTWSWKPSESTSTTSSPWWKPSTTSSTTSSTTTTAATQSTTQTWWPTSSTTTTTTTASTPPASSPSSHDEASMEGMPCGPGDYHAAAGECEFYLQCVSGTWRKQKCAPGLHWNNKDMRCDWPSLAKCSNAGYQPANPSGHPPAPEPTTTTTAAPISSTSTASDESISSGGDLEGDKCSGDYSAVTGDCSAYLQCSSGVWRKFKCAHSLHWNTIEKRCDWPKYAKCQDRPSSIKPPASVPAPTEEPTSPSSTTAVYTTTARPESGRPMQGQQCHSEREYRPVVDDCNAYLVCSGGAWRKLQCAPGLHWSPKSDRCDWPRFAGCEGYKPESVGTASTTKRPLFDPVTSRPTARPSKPTNAPVTSTTRKPQAASSDLEGSKCTSADEYRSVPGDCGSYLQCDSSTWRRHRCAPGLHWSEAARRCDWPAQSKCNQQSTAKPTTQTSPANTQDVTVETSEGKSCLWRQYRTSGPECKSYLQCVGGFWRLQQCPIGMHYDSRNKRCNEPKIAMCKKHSNYISTSTTARIPITSLKPIVSTQPPRISPTEKRCSSGSYHRHQRCGMFYICVNGELMERSCPAGLHWNEKRSACDFPTRAKCISDNKLHSSAATLAPMVQQTTKISDATLQNGPCEDGTYSGYPGDCSRYRHCLWGKFEEYGCSPGLHWNQEKQICDWPENAHCTDGSSASIDPDQSLDEPIPQKPSKPLFPTVTMTPTTQRIPTSTVSLDGVQPDLLKTNYKLVCYFTNWAWYRPGLGKYVPEDIDPTMCTHIVYGFAVLGYDGTIKAHDSWADFDNRFYQRVVEYKKHGMKVSLALGGWNDSAGDKYSKLVNSPSARAKFNDHAVEFLLKFGFDGLDLDWEYPKCWQVDCSKGPDSDKEGFSAWVRELAAAFKPHGLLLSSAVSPNKKVIDAGYDVPVLAKYMEWIAVMTYDYHGQWDKKTGHVAPLYYHPEDDVTYFNANYTMNYWMEKGAPASKLVMGIPLYGQSFTLGTQWDTPPELLAKKNETGLNVPARSGGEAGEFTRAKGFLAYYEICERLKSKAWTVVRDPLGRMGPYAFKGDQWVSFDDVNIIKKKIKFIQSHKLAGAMVWALDLDDFKNRCGEGRHPLLNTIKNGLLDVSYKEDIIHSFNDPQPSPIPQDTDDDDFVVTPPISGSPAPPTEEKPHPPPIINKPEMPVIISPPVEVTPIETVTSISPPVDHSQYKVVCYFTNWAWYRPGPGKYTPADIDTSLCTHIVYAFAVLDGSRLIMKPHDSWADIDNKFYEKVVALKSKGVRVVLGLGGWNDSAGDKYSRLVNSPSARRTFIVHAIDFLQQYGFEGLDLDWEYPKCWQVECNKGPASDKQGFASLVRELREAFNPHNLLLSAAVSPNKKVIDAGYDVPVISENLDWISVMTYDYHGQWDKKTGHNAPMYVRDDDEVKTFNVNFTIHYWIEQGAAREKIILGMPLYGQSFSLAEGNGAGLNVPTYGGGEAGDETRARGFLAFYEICERIRVRGWRVVKDPSGAIGPYATKGDQWVSFDDDFMLKHKSEYIRAMGLGGGMVWALDLDDFTGKYCGCGKSPLLSNINAVLRGRAEPQHCILTGLSPDPVPALPSRPANTPSTGGLPSSTPTDSDNEISPDGGPCSGPMFKPDPENCSKYYLCNNGRYQQLSCPPPLHWHENRCDWPSKSKCSSNKAQIKLAPKDEVDQPMVVCYFTSWSYYRKGEGSFSPQDIDASLCSHVVYAWASLDSDTSQLKPRYEDLDVDRDFFGKVTALRLKGIKVLLGAGGWRDSVGDKWSKMAASPELRNIFIDSASRLLRRWQFDGLNLAWEFPTCSQGICKEERMGDKDSLNSLVMDLAKELRPMGLELALTVAARPDLASRAYDPQILTATADWLLIAAYDYHGSWERETAHTAPLISNDSNNVNASLTYWLETGVPARQLVLGVPSYGHSYTLQDPTKTTPPAPAIGPGLPGPLTDVPGFLSYYEICTGVAAGVWQVEHSPEGSYAWSGSQWASYQSPADVTQAVRLAKDKNIRGAALWALDLDDWRGACGCGPHPILRSIRGPLLDLNTPGNCPA